jgi:hypothetical protein
MPAERSRSDAAALPRLGVLLAGALSVALAASAGGCRRAPPAAPAPARARPPVAASAPGEERRSPRIEMKNVDLLVMPDVVLEVRLLFGELEGVGPDGVPVFDDPRSFRIVIDRAETAISARSLAALLNGYTFAYPGSPLGKLEVKLEKGRIVQSGVLRKKVDIPFELAGELALTAQGLLRIHPKSVRIAGVPVKKLLDLFDVELANLINARRDRGVQIDGDDLLLDPDRLMPLPSVRGRVVSARLAGDRLLLTFAPQRARPTREADLHPSWPAARGYLYMQGGRLRLGKLMMLDTDLQIVDADPRDPFLFFLSRFQEQLAAGYSKTLPDQGLVTVAPDFNDLAVPLRPPAMPGAAAGRSRP